MPLEHRSVEVFSAIVQTGSATRAAKQLRTSQPTISRELARLERTLGLQLFDRQRGRLVATDAALRLFEEVQRSYIGLHRIETAAQALRDKSGGQLTIACLPTFAETLLPRAASAWLGAHPTASLSVTTLESPLLDNWLSEQRVHLGLVEHDQAPPGTDRTPVLTADEVCVLPAGHPLLARRRLAARDFADQPFIGFSPDDPYRAAIDAIFTERGIRRNCRIDTTSAASACALVEQGLGLTLVNPLTAIQHHGPTLHIRQVDFSIPFQVSAVTGQHRSQHPLQQALQTAIQSVADDILRLVERLIDPA